MAKTDFHHTSLFIDGASSIFSLENVKLTFFIEPPTEAIQSGDDFITIKFNIKTKQNGQSTQIYRHNLLVVLSIVTGCEKLVSSLSWQKQIFITLLFS